MDKAVDYQKTRFEDAVRDVDLVLDTVGGETLERSFKVLKKGGILVSLVQPPSQESATKYGVRALFYGGHASSSDLAEIAKLIDDGKVKPVVETVLPLAEARRAHELSETRHVARQDRFESRVIWNFHPKQKQEKRQIQYESSNNHRSCCARTDLRHVRLKHVP